LCASGLVSHWLVVGEWSSYRKPVTTDEPDERIVHVRFCGGGAGNCPFYPARDRGYAGEKIKFGRVMESSEAK